MTEIRAAARPGGLPPVAISSTVAVAVAGGVLAMLLHPTLGLYASDGVAMVCALPVAGMAVFATIAPREMPVRRWLRRFVVVLAVTGSVATLLTVPFDIMSIADNGIRGLGNGLARSAAWHSGQYATALTRVAGLVVVAWGFRASGKRAEWLAVFGALVIFASFAMTGHARTHTPTVAVVATLVAHVAAAATWFGGLIGLALSLRRVRADDLAAGRVLAAFARSMTFVLALLLAAGVGLTILYLPSPRALVATTYGQVLLVKLAALLGVLVLSAANHVRLVPAAVRGNATAVRVLRANVAAEQFGLLAIVVITEVLMRQNPGG